MLRRLTLLYALLALPLLGRTEAPAGAGGGTDPTAAAGAAVAMETIAADAPPAPVAAAAAPVAPSPEQAPAPVQVGPPRPDPAAETEAAEAGPGRAGAAAEGAQRSGEDAQAAPRSEAQPLRLLGQTLAPGTRTRLTWDANQAFAGLSRPTPVLVIHGAHPGPRLCLTAGIHGDELNGMEIVRRIHHDLAPQALAGTLVGVPIANLHAFYRGSRYLPDRRDLNRHFPGTPDGSMASRIADAFFQDIVRHCDALIDFHTGSLRRTNTPQFRANLRLPSVVELTRGLGDAPVLHSEGAEGTLRRAATDAGIPAVTFEAGGPHRLQDSAIEHGVDYVLALLDHLGMHPKFFTWGRQPVYYDSLWVRAERGGFLFSTIELGERVDKDQVLGTITDPITDARTVIRAPVRGQVLGMAYDQVVMPGFAAYRIGVVKDEPGAIAEDGEAEQVSDDTQPLESQPREEDDDHAS